MVWAVCRRVLHNLSDADDAFQATFLVLVSKASSITKRESVGSWLHGVAYRTASRARARAARRGTQEQPLYEVPDPLQEQPGTQVACEELREMLDEELGRLPEKYRLPLVLCYLEGKTNQEAAQQLGWPLGTVQIRLLRAREMLRTRLTRRGAVQSGHALAAFMPIPSQAAVPSGLAATTLRMAVLLTGDHAGAGMISAQVAALAKGVLQTMLLTQLKVAITVLLAVGIAGTAVAVLGQRVLAEKERNPQKDEKLQLAAEAEPKEREAKKERDEVQGQRDEIQALNHKLQATQVELRSTLYAAHMNLAHKAWDEGAIVRVLELLDQYARPRAGENDLRGFEWNYLNRLCHAEILTLGGVGSMAYSPDGKRLASPNGDNTANVWDALTGQELLSLKGHTGRVLSVAYSPDGKRLASAASDKIVKVWDAQTGKELRTLKGDSGEVYSLVYSPDGKHLASTSEDKTVTVWDAQTGQPLLILEGAGECVAYSPDGKRLASGSAGYSWGVEVKVWDAQTGQVHLTIKGAGRGVAFSPDGKRLASTSWDETVGVLTVKVWDAQTGAILLTIKPDTGLGQVNSVAFSPDGKRLASADGGGTVKVWDAQTGQELLAFKGHIWPARSVVFSPDGTRLAASFQMGGIKIWDATTSPEVRSFRGPTDAVVFSPDSKRLASRNGDNTVKAWDAQTGQELRVFKGHTGRVRSVAYSPDGKRLASAAEDRLVKVWDVQTGQEILALKGHTSSVTSVAYSPDGKRLASAAEDGLVKVWDAQTGRELLSLPGGGGSLAYSPDGKRLAGASGGTVRVWDATNGQEILAWEAPGRVRGVAFSPDGKRLAGNVDDPFAGPPGPGAGYVKVWDAQTGDELLHIKGHTGWVGSVAFSPDGKRLASGSDGVAWGGEVKVWDAQTGQELLSFQGGGNLHNVVFSPNGHWLASSVGGTVKIYDGTPPPKKPSPKRGR
jgi:RNA polymerase sigma factor (sigma-70 family)